MQPGTHTGYGPNDGTLKRGFPELVRGGSGSVDLILDDPR
jgi:hypothetical protein